MSQAFWRGCRGAIRLTRCVFSQKLPPTSRTQRLTRREDAISRRRTRSLRLSALVGSLALPLAGPASASEVTFERLANADREPQNWLMNHRTYDALEAGT